MAGIPRAAWVWVKASLGVRKEMQRKGAVEGMRSKSKGWEDVWSLTGMKIKGKKEKEGNC